jgi:hypothetical protein
MSIAEMKVLAFEKLSALNEEAAIKEILMHLEKFGTTQNKFNTDAFFEEMNTRYGDVLQKLAQ